MKNYIITILVLFSFASSLKAQLAVVNSQKVIASMKEFAKIDTLVAKETSSYTTEYNKKQAELNKLVIYADSLIKVDAKSAAATKAITLAQTAEKDLKAYAEVANRKIAEYKQLLTKPYTDKVMAAIKAVALRAKYMQVLDSSTTNVLYLNPAADITQQVIKELLAK